MFSEYVCINGRVVVTVIMPSHRTGVRYIFLSRCLDNGEGANVEEHACHQGNLAEGFQKKMGFGRSAPFCIVEIPGRENLPHPLLALRSAILLSWRTVFFPPPVLFPAPFYPPVAALPQQFRHAQTALVDGYNKSVHLSLSDW